MASTKLPVMLDHQNGGIDRSVRPHHVGSGEWYDAFNLRFVREGIIQIPRKYIYARTATEEDYTRPVTNLTFIPKGRFGRGYLVGFGSREIFSVRDREKMTIASWGTADATYHVSDYPFVDRWATVVWDGKVYFTNPVNKIRATDGGMIETFADETPAAAYMVEFYDHLVVANIDYFGRSPNRVAWSDLQKFAGFAPTRHNEADHYDCIESSNPSMNEITGLKKLGRDLVAIYTSSTIYGMQYVGKPTLMKIDPLFDGIGSDLPHSVVGVDGLHFFISMKYRNIFMFNGEAPVPIGDKIFPFFEMNVSQLPEDLAATWSFVDEQNNEVWWVYKSRTAFGSALPEFDRAIVFNVKDKRWYRASTERLTAYASMSRPSKDITDIGHNLISLGDDNSTIAVLTQDFGVLKRVFASATGEILVENDGTVLKNLLYHQPVPVLETGDMYFGDFQAMKEIETMVPQCNLGTSSGLKVSVSKRVNIDDAMTWEILPQRWTPTLREGRMSPPRGASRIWRFKFEPVAVTYPYLVVTFSAASGVVGIQPTVPDLDGPDPVAAPSTQQNTTVTFNSSDANFHAVRVKLSGYASCVNYDRANGIVDNTQYHAGPTGSAHWGLYDENFSYLTGARTALWFKTTTSGGLSFGVLNHCGNKYDDTLALDIFHHPGEWPIQGKPINHSFLFALDDGSTFKLAMQAPGGFTDQWYIPTYAPLANPSFGGFVDNLGQFMNFTIALVDKQPSTGEDITGVDNFVWSAVIYNVYGLQPPDKQEK